MLGDELHNILYYSEPKLIVKWAQMFAVYYSYHEDHTGIRMSAELGATLSDEKSKFEEGPHFTSDCGFIKYLFLEREVDEITKSLQRFLNLKAFL
jgi:hypothetical protein